jgi:hypothetical protein
MAYIALLLNDLLTLLFEPICTHGLCSVSLPEQTVAHAISCQTSQGRSKSLVVKKCRVGVLTRYSGTDPIPYLVWRSGRDQVAIDIVRFLAGSSLIARSQRDTVFYLPIPLLLSLERIL